MPLLPSPCYECVLLSDCVAGDRAEARAQEEKLGLELVMRASFCQGFD